MGQGRTETKNLNFFRAQTQAETSLPHQCLGASGTCGPKYAIPLSGALELMHVEPSLPMPRAPRGPHPTHAPCPQITSLAFSQDGNTLLSRGMDETLKIWDLRKWVVGSVYGRIWMG